MRAGSVGELAVAEFTAPEVARPRQAVLRARADVGGERTANKWRFWFFPRDAWAGTPGVRLVDPGGRLGDLAELVPGGVASSDPQAVVVATRWTTGVRDHVGGGGHAVLLADEAADSPVPLVAMPFWREAVKVPEPHAAWGDFPHEGWVDLQFGGCATDLALDVASLAEKAGADRLHGEARPILRRVDARTAHVHDYATDAAWGRGRVLLSTLRFEGGAGDQPRGLRRNVGASYLLSRWVAALG